MKKYRLEYSEEIYGWAIVEADNEEEAQERWIDGDTLEEDSRTTENLVHSIKEMPGR